MEYKNLLLLLIFTGSLCGCSSPGKNSAVLTPISTVVQPPEKTKLVVFAAGSLIVPFQELEQAFEAVYPEIDVQMEYHGSIQVIRHVTEIHEEIDVVASADAALIPQLMFQSIIPETDQPYADWSIRFAGNKLALAYQKKSHYADEITSDNWAEILARPDVRLGLSDPRFDALGYRALMAFALQEAAQQNYSLFTPMFTGQFNPPVTIFREESSTQISVPEILETASSAHILMRGASIQLVALLQSGDIDYAFEYESVIRQHGLKMLALANTVNLGISEMDSFYRQVEVELDFKRFASIQPQFFGERIGYGITIPNNAPHPEAAEKFIAFLLSEPGRAVMEKNYHPMFTQPLSEGFENLPQSLIKFVEPMDGS
ncbi:MAG: tungstate ABC transporter substrate-binding protein WtpA [Chloroflexi bacterium HGW-Chloroflexi-10]|nr:MAG: tungstate ABC transporter substrate-binding protein WtpA [Chloroflexi bacterium HGW-Chloroflexi-10]